MFVTTNKYVKLKQVIYGQNCINIKKIEEKYYTYCETFYNI